MGGPNSGTGGGWGFTSPENLPTYARSQGGVTPGTSYTGTALDPRDSGAARWAMFNRGGWDGTYRGLPTRAGFQPNRPTFRTINGVRVGTPTPAPVPEPVPEPVPTPEEAALAATAAAVPPPAEVTAPAAPTRAKSSSSSRTGSRGTTTSYTGGGSAPYTPTMGGRGSDRLPKPPKPPATPIESAPAPVATVPQPTVINDYTVPTPLPARQPILGGLYGRGATASNMSAGDPRGRGARRIG